MNRRFACTSLVAIAASLGFALASPSAFAEGTKTIGLAVANLQADFFNQIKQSVVAYAKQKGVNVITVDAKGDAATQVNQIQDLLTRNIDALIYIPAGATAAGVPVRAAKAAGVPVIAVDRNAPDAPGDTFIATDSEAAAEQLGNWIVAQTKGEGTVAELQGQLGTTPELAREKGFTQSLSKAPGLKVVARQSADWAQDKGFAVAQDMLQKDPNISVIFGHADAMALGAAQATKIAGVGHKVLIAGFDGDFAGLKAVRDGVIDVTMTQQTQRMGRMAVDSALELIAKKKVPAQQLLPATLTTKANVGPFITNHP
jgi:ribose transport system substrate-binding protein